MQQPQLTDAADLVSEALKTHPEVNPEAVRAASPDAAPPPISSTAPTDDLPRDKSGAIFNPAKHYADQYGRPQWTTGGYFRKKPWKKILKEYGKRLLNPEVAPESAPEPEHTPETPEPASEEAPPPFPKSHIPSEDPPPEASGSHSGASAESLAHSSADVVVNSIFGLAIARYGRECEPLPQHREAMTAAYRRYFAERNITIIPPWAEVAITTGSYFIFVHSASQAAQQEVRGVWGWTVHKFAGWRAKLAARRALRKTAPKQDA